MKHYTDLFIDFDDTLYDTHGNAVIALQEIYDFFHLEQYFERPSQFTDPYWLANVLLWSQYSKGEIERPYLIVERFRRPLAQGLLRNEKGEFTTRHFEPTEAFCLQVSDKFLELCSVKPGVVPGAHELMRYLKGKGYRCHLCSNGFHEVQYKKLQASALYEFFDTIILSEDAGSNKPSAAYFAYAFERSGACPESTLMIGDNFVTDIQGAQAAGLDVLFFNAHPQDFTAPEPVNFEVNTLKEIMSIL